MGLRKGQKELVEQYRGGFCAVPAIPGGGKTHCLSLWAVEMISSGLHKPGKILIVTYMNTAVNNFKQRISNELSKIGVAGSRDYFVCTIHGLCMQIIKEKPDLLAINEDFEILDDTKKMNIISSSLEEWRKKNEDIFRVFIDDSQLSANKMAATYIKWQKQFCIIALNAIGDFKCRGMNPSQAIKECEKLPNNSLLKCSSQIYEFYDRKLKMGGLLDFDDMLYNAKRLLVEDETLLQKFRDKYSFVCEDEAQDSNSIQSEILTMIADGNLLRVGDSNQAICGSFTSSDFKLFKSFCENKRTTVFNITQSSRNTKDIIDLANYFVKYVRENHPVEDCRDSLLSQYIETVSKDDERRNPEIPEYGIKAQIFNSWDEEADYVVKKASQMLKEHPDKTMAILIPSSWRINQVVGILEARHIPFEQLDNTSSERNKTLRVLGRIIDFIALPESGEKFADMVDDCFLSDDYESANNDTGDKVANQKELLKDFIKSYPTEKILYPIGGEIETKDIPEELSKSKIWGKFTEKLDLIRGLLEFPPTVVEKLILYIAEKLNFDRGERAIAQKVASDVRYLMSQDANWRLSDLSLELLSPKNMFNFFAGIVWDLKGYEPKQGVITVATYHKAKGLEWDVVFLTSLNNEDFPVVLSDKFKGEYWYLKQQYRNPQAILKCEMEKLSGENKIKDSILESKLETISEKARLLYVGITRAREYLYLSGFHANQGRKNETLPSRYLLELNKYAEEAG